MIAAAKKALEQAAVHGTKRTSNALVMDVHLSGADIARIGVMKALNRDHV